MERKTETLVCFSTYLCICWLILVCALTGDWTCSLGILPELLKLSTFLFDLNFPLLFFYQKHLCTISLQHNSSRTLHAFPGGEGTFFFPLYGTYLWVNGQNNKWTLQKHKKRESTVGLGEKLHINFWFMFQKYNFTSWWIYIFSIGTNGSKLR